MSKEIENDVMFNELKDLLINYYDVKPNLIKLNANISVDLWLDEEIDNLINDLEILFEVDFSDFEKGKYDLDFSVELFPLLNFISRYKKEVRKISGKKQLLISDIIKSIKAKKWIYSD